MNIRRKKKKRIDIADSGALSDLAFLLIIFFIIIAVFNINKGFILELPKKNSQKIVNIQDIMKVNLLKDGTLEKNGVPLGLEELENEAREVLAVYPNATLLLHIHPETVYQRVVEVVEVVRLLEVENFSFSMKEDI